MRFLLFNIVVVVALVHLFAGDPSNIGASVERAAEKLRTTVADVANPAPKPAPTAEPAPQPEPVRPAPPKQVAEAIAEPVAPPLPEPVAVEKPVVHEAPVPDAETAARRDEVLWGSVAPDLAPDTFLDAFDQPAVPQPADTTRDRRQALMTLAEEMELFSLEQLNP